MEQLKSYSFFCGKWIEGNPPIIGPLSHGSWLGSPVFDGARIFDGFAPDLDKHCDRVIESAKNMLMTPPVSAEEIVSLTSEGLKLFPGHLDIYVRPLIWAESSMGLLRCDPYSAKFCLTIIHMPMPEDRGFSACLSNYRKPAADSAPTDAKAACLYPNGARAIQEASEKGFENAVMLDQEGYIAEFASANLFAVVNDEIITPEHNNTFLNGITRKRVLILARNLGFSISERKVKPEELEKASEIFNTGNFGKLMFVNRYQNKTLPKGPIYKALREAYWDFSSSQTIQKQTP